MSGSSLEISNIKVTRSGRDILSVDHLSIAGGDFINIIGPNGSGKTTLLKILCGLLRPSFGTIKISDIDIFSTNSWHRSTIRKQIGYIPQSAEYNWQLPFTVRQIVAMGRSAAKPLLSRLNSFDYSLTDDWLKRVGLFDKRYQTFRSLSGGEQQKVLIGRAMAQEPKILMLDEPTSNLDFHWKLKISRLVQDLQRQLNLTVLMISHEITSIPLTVGRTILLDSGRILADGDSAAILTSSVLEQVYQCRIQAVEIAGSKYIINQAIIE